MALLLGLVSSALAGQVLSLRSEVEAHCGGPIEHCVGSLEVVGEALDVACYRLGRQGESHSACASRCLAGGGEVAVWVEGEVLAVDRRASDQQALRRVEVRAGKRVRVRLERDNADEAWVLRSASEVESEEGSASDATATQAH